MLLWLFVMGKGCSEQPYCIPTLHGGHTGLRRHDAIRHRYDEVSGAGLMQYRELGAIADSNSMARLEI
jgi:hypothetical protein